MNCLNYMAYYSSEAVIGATANRLIVDSVDHGISQQYQNGVGTSKTCADAILPKGHFYTAHGRRICS